MKCNEITRLLFDWNKMTQKEKLKYLQEVENSAADFYGRARRTVKVNEEFCDSEILNGRDAAAFYDAKNPQYLNYIWIDDDPFEMILLTIHEGLHAACDDYRNGKIDLGTISKLNEEEYKTEFQYADYLFEHFMKRNEETPGAMFVLDAAFVEERFAHKESCIYLFKRLIESAENPFDLSKLNESGALFACFSHINENAKHRRMGERLINEKYSDVLKNIMANCEPDTTVFTGDKKIYQLSEANLLSCFTNAHYNFNIIDSCARNPYSSDEELGTAYKEFIRIMKTYLNNIKSLS